MMDAEVLPAEAARGGDETVLARHPLRFLAQFRAQVLFGMGCLLLTNGLSQGIPWLVKRAIDALERATSSREAALLALLVAVVAIAQAGIRIVSRITIFNAGRDAEFRLRFLLFRHLCRLDGAFFQRMRTGELMSRLTNDIAAVRSLFGPGVLHATNTVFAYAFALPLMIRIDEELTLLALLPYPLLLFGARAFARGVYGRSHAQQRALAEMTSLVQEDLAGIRELKSYRLEAKRSELFARASASYKHEALRLAVWRAGMLPFVGAGAGLSLVLVLWLGGLKVIRGEISLGDLVALNLYVDLLAWPTMAIGWMVAVWQRGLAGWHRLVEVTGQQPALRQGPGALPLPLVARQAAEPRSAAGAKVPPIELRQLSVHLDGRPVIEDVSFSIEPGSICAIVGKVGSGKSTLVEAIARLIPITTGHLYWGGVDVTTLQLDAVRAQIAYAPQESFLFSQSLRDNIAVGLPASGLSPTEVACRIQEAVQVAGLEPDIEALPDGLDTIVGERGVSLSGGQRQRVALARAIVAHRPLLMLDDSLSAVDAETERRILERLRVALRETTTVLTSHRLSALRYADKVVVLDSGKIADVGGHAELLARDGIYAQLYRRQLLEQRT